jgi:hypothetical protein
VTMQPAFHSRGHMVAYVAFAATCLALPPLLAAAGRPTRSDAYRSLRPTSGAYAYVERETLDERSDVDMVFVGASHIVAGIDTVLVQSELAAVLGRTAVARTLGFSWTGLDASYAVLRDLLEHRRVGTVVLMMPLAEDDADAPHPMAYRLLDFLHHGDCLSSMSWKHRAQLYGDFVLGAPRHLLSWLRPNLPDRAIPHADTLGGTDETFNLDGSPFRPIDLPHPDLPPAFLIYSPISAAHFQFANKPMTSYQAFFAHRIVALLKDHGSLGVAIHVPTWPERRSPFVTERLPWSDVLGLALVGIPGAVLFEGVSDEDLPGFYYDARHLNRNGRVRFTRSVLPALIKLHVDRR